MRQQQKFITTLSLIVALSGLSPVMAADAGTASAENTRPIRLSHEQMDQVSGGWIFESCHNGSCIRMLSNGTFHAWHYQFAHNGVFVNNGGNISSYPY